MFCVVFSNDSVTRFSIYYFDIKIIYIEIYIYTNHRKNGSQHNKKTPIIMPSVRAALCSARHPLAGLIDPPVNLCKRKEEKKHIQKKQ